LLQDQRQTIGLAGTWDFRFEEDREWRSINVPGCWDALDGVAKNISGPAWYRKRIDIPREFAGRRIWIRFDAVSYHCIVSVNDKEVGTHTGAWDAFTFEITDAIRAGEQAEILVRVEKPASLTAGPDSKPVAGNFPLKQTLSGFLPYVWGHMFGGIWQDVSIFATGPTRIERFAIRGSADGRCIADVQLSNLSRSTIEVIDSTGQTIRSTDQLQFTIPNPRTWSPHDPHLYTARLATDGDEQTIRFGLRTQSIAPDGTTLLLNNEPIFPRMILSWGWYPESLHSNPGPDRVRADFKRLKSLGYNGVKLCLWFPPQYYFDIADETGMLLWVELPMWLPDPTPTFRKQLFAEYRALMLQASAHPSVILYTLGCELNASIGADILGPLFEQTKPLAGDALVRDNSGGGDAYGGLLNEHAEFYDYHFYSDLQFFRPLLDYYAPRGRPAQPWNFGEFCDLDTFRDLRHLYIANHDAKPWWSVRDEKLNPQGARWQFDIVDWEARLKANGLWDRGDELTKLSYKHALLHRKFTLESVRLYREIGGYVVTGETDTPISTAGMFDDLGQLKFAGDDAEAFKSSNDDIVLCVAWDRRRAWINGGDRAAPWDNFCYTAGATVRAHIVVSHFGRSRGRAKLRWLVRLDDQTKLAAGEVETKFELAPGMLRELAVAEFKVPTLIDKPLRATLRATVQIGDERSTNSWPIWFFPRDVWKDVTNVALFDPAGRLAGLPVELPTKVAPNSLVIATTWSDELDRHLAGGGRAIVLLSSKDRNSPVPIAELPFWRETIRLIERDHPSWRDFPIDTDGFAGLQFFGLATDCALDTSKLPERATAKPVLRRLDARTVRLQDYTTELNFPGGGRAIISTLRFEGSVGLANSSQPLGITRNIAASYLLRQWVRALQS
jgi:hypothetical protein